ncbi:MAG: hypothetical protein ACKPKO_59265, partial [Candidatus Fonsibacter sp.]
RLDVAATFCRRWLLSRERNQVFRYLAYDALPQGGVEVLAPVERVLTLTHAGHPPLVQERRLPWVTLGHGRTTLFDKLQSHFHQVWLEYGPGVESVERASSAVRQCLSDMGTEFGLADAADVTHICMRTGDGKVRGAVVPLGIAGAGHAAHI